MEFGTYVLITAAKNEDQFIENTILSVLKQTRLPGKWVIVSDGSTDNTDTIVESYANEHRFMQLVKSLPGENRSFGSQVNALKAGYKELANIAYDYIGTLDADVTFEPSYYENMLREFQQHPKLGIAGGNILQKEGERFAARINSPDSVAGAVQMFRRECYEQVGGFLQLKIGGHDAAAGIMARMHGWEVKTFLNYPVYHHRLVGSGVGNVFKNKLRLGKMDYQLGYLFGFEVIRCFYRILENPILLGSLVRFWGYFSGWIQRQPRELPEAAVQFLQNEQKAKLKKWFRIPL